MMKKAPVNLRWFGLAVFLAWSLHAQPTGHIIFNSIDAGGGVVSTHLSVMNADGTQAQPFPLSLRNPYYPAWSRDGQSLVMGASDPARPFKWSTDIFLLRLNQNQIFKLTSLEDIANLAGFITQYPT